MTTTPVPDVSLVIPCLNEEGCIETTATELLETFETAGVALELVLVDNGSTDGTLAIIDRLVARHRPVVKATVPVNHGVGLGVLTGFAKARGRYIGHVCADRQVTAADVLAVYRCVGAAGVPVLAKARRRFRQENWVRKPLSLVYNAMMLAVFPGMPCLDVNGTPKILPRDVVRLMALQSHDWFLDAEMMIKARHLRLRVVEIDVFGQSRKASQSHVRASTVVEFLRNIAAYRAGGPWREWRRRTQPVFDPQGLAVDARAAKGVTHA